MKIRMKWSFMIFLVGLGMMLAGCQKMPARTGDKPPVSEPKTSQLEMDTEMDSENAASTTAVSGLYEIIEWNTKNSTIKLYDLKRERRDDYAYDEMTNFLDKYGNRTAISQMMPGRIVSIELTRQTGPLLNVQISDVAWEYDDIKRFSIDEEKNMIIIADTKYYYEEDLNVFSDEERTRLSDISKKDILRIIGIDKKIYSVSITSGHATIQFKNTELFEGGWLSLGTKIYMQITKDMQMEVAEGTYLLSVANDGYGDNREITINRGEQLIIDLDELKGEGPKYCKITFDLGIEDALVKIDGEYVDISEPIEIKYGIHKLVIDAEGYETWSRRLYVNSPDATIEIQLTTEGTSSSTENSTEKSTEKATEKTSEKKSSSKTTESTSSQDSTWDSSKDSYIKTLSDIIDTLTGGKSD